MASNLENQRNAKSPNLNSIEGIHVGQSVGYKQASSFVPCLRITPASTSLSMHSFCGQVEFMEESNF